MSFERLTMPSSRLRRALQLGTACALSLNLTLQASAKPPSEDIPSLPHVIKTEPTDFIAKPYDYIVIGGGTAGLVVATRLTEDPNVSVAVLEAGAFVAPGTDPRLDISAQYGSAFGDAELDWNLKTIPQEGLDGRVVDQPIGRVLGGSSMICDLLWQRAAREEYDAWGTTLGNGPTWSFDALQPYFKKSENWTAPPLDIVPGAIDDVTGLSDVFGRDGPIQLSYNNFHPDTIAPAVEAAYGLGVKTNPNPNTGDPSGFSTPARAVDPQTGMRSSALSAYLMPNSNRTNLSVLTRAQATKIVFASQTSGSESSGPARATAVEFIHNNASYTVRASKEIIVSTGALRTPHLLELSGIGGKKHLESLGIENVVDLPGVGENFQDQTFTLLDVKMKEGLTTLDRMRYDSAFAEEQMKQFATNQTGLLTYDTPATASAPLQTLLSPENITFLESLMPSDLLNTTLSTSQKAQYALQRQFFDEGKVGWVELLLLAAGGVLATPEGNASYSTPIVFNLYPFARGSVHINSSDPLAPPRIDPAYFSHDFDVAMHALTTAWLRKWMQTEPMASLVESANVPSEKDVSTFEEWKAYSKKSAVSTLHPLGTAALGPEHLGGVVAPDFLVHRTANLRVVDASVIPLSFSVAPLATVYAIAEKAADEIKLAQTTLSNTAATHIGSTEGKHDEL
ncbi:GMC oxidoreductase [Peniophora sp. CONT]|nr:GMC oxidoreductase [Peniophora sp. CONT]